MNFNSTVFRISSSGESVLYGSSGSAVGSNAALIRDASGTLYGTTTSGGLNGLGTIFQLNSAGLLTVLHDFTLQEGTDPYGGLVRDSSGNFYGAAAKGGAFGNGSVFKLGFGGDLSILHQFAGPPDGAAPVATLLLENGELLGTTGAGGVYNSGTVFRCSISTGATTVLYSFSGGADGALPQSTLIPDGRGNVCGTTLYGGAGADFGNGVVFSLNLATRTFKVLHTFIGPDGRVPSAGLIRDSNGNLYGTTTKGGTSDLGTVFALNQNGVLTVLHSFTGGADGANPYAGLVRDAKGRLYGAAEAGGTAGYGTIFVITP